MLNLHLANAFMRPRNGASEESASDVTPSTDSDSVSSTNDDPALTQQSLSQVTHAQPQDVRNNSMPVSIIRSDHIGKPHRNLSLAQLALADTEEGPQSKGAGTEKKKVRFFLPSEHEDSSSDKREVTCGGYTTESGLSFDCCCRKSMSSHAFCLPTAIEDDEALPEGSPDPHGHAAGLGFCDGPRHEAPRRNQF